MNKNHKLIIFAKAPIPGKVKTRLRTHLSEVECAELQEHLITETLKNVMVLGDVSCSLAGYPGIKHPFLIETSREFHIDLFAQKGSDLGKRMENAISRYLGKGYRKVIIIGSDSPDLPVHFIDEGFRYLETHDLVLGPSSDGGYYLIGMSSCLNIFDSILWGSSNVFERTMSLAKSLGLSIYILPEWYDIDTWKDLERYRGRNR